ncbi:ferritin-like domain-containing protein [Halodesulfovibrio marinisediminis]|uniref:Bacterioferritin n=1 Tax=Halodesulfovibrio marinisediminis DSM 17456 TaxID=1121457 RepID=A0A1N6H6M6_9BACT|nr:ferritin-like domain-containing protein [Halodesulfovibrio marinisediminis]SIO15345.1 bacterioferritin [Halodesulfovibrio marinisediminis DSM 17456]
MNKSDKDARRQNVIEVLNKARSMELHAITQYMNQHYGLDDMDYGELAKQVKLIALDEMRHAEMFAERIKELGGEPTAEQCCPVERKQPVKRIFPFDANQEDDTIDQYNQFLIVCRENGDSVSQKIFETVIEEEQLHYNYFDAIAGHIEKLGDVYLSKIAGTPASTGLASQGFAVTGGGE